MTERRSRGAKRRIAVERSQERIDRAQETLRAELGLLFRIHALSYVMTRRPRRESALHSGLSLVAWRVLTTVVSEPGLSANEIVALWGLEKMGVNRAVSTLIERGLVEQGRDPDGGRRIPLMPTQAGDDFFADAWPGARDDYDTLGSALTPRQLETFNRHADRLLAQARKITDVE